MSLRGALRGVPAEGVAKDGLPTGARGRLPPTIKLFFIAIFLMLPMRLFSEDVIDLGTIFTYIDAPDVEEKITLTAEEIAELHVATLTELLRTQGIQIKSYGGYGNESSPSIRGFTGGAIKVIVDGATSNSAQLGTFDFSSINPDTIEKIEIVKSGFNKSVSAESGSGGTIFITTKKQALGHHFGADLSAKTYFYNPFDTYKLNLNYTGQVGENSFLKSDFGGVFAKNEFPFKAASAGVTSSVTARQIRGNNEVKDGKSNVSFTHYFGNGNSFDVTENFYISDKEIPGAVYSADAAKQNDFNNAVSVGIKIPAIANCVKADAHLSWISTNMLYKSAAEDSRHYLNTVSFNSTATYYGLDFYEQSAGVSLAGDFLDSTDAGNVNRFSGFAKETAVLKFMKNYSVFVPLSLNFSAANFEFVPSLGFRADYNYISFFLNGTKLFLFPTLNQLYWNDSVYASGNPGLKPENGWGGEVGVEVHKIPVPFAVTFFANYYENKIQWQSEGGKWIPKNVSSAFYIGVDFSAETKLRDFLTLKIDYEFLHNELLGEGLAKGKMIMYTPNHVFDIMAKFDFPICSVIANGHFVSRRYVSNLNVSFLEPYFLLDFSLEFYPAKWIAPYLKIQNALNQNYQETEDYPMPGISLEIGARLKW